jgi:hypothetical protein
MEVFQQQGFLLVGAGGGLVADLPLRLVLSRPVHLRRGHVKAARNTKTHAQNRSNDMATDLDLVGCKFS